MRLPLDVDRKVAAAIRQRRIMAGMTQMQLAEAIGVTYQQAHKYEAGINRISAARLWRIAQALGCTVGDLFESVEQETLLKEIPEREVLELVPRYVRLSPKLRDAVRHVVSVLAKTDVEYEQPEREYPGMDESPARRAAS